MTDYDLVVLGTGGVGSATLLHAAQQGARTIGLDRFIAPHNRGSSHGETRIIRQAYFEHPSYTPLLVESYRLWSELEEAVGRQLYYQTGLLQVGPADGIVIPGVLKSAKEHGLVVETLDSKTIESRWPVFRIPTQLVGVLEPKAGYLLVEDCVAAHLEAAKAAGAKIEAPGEVLGWEPGVPIRVRTTIGTLKTKHLIISAGAWADSLLADLNLRLEVLRKSVFWYAARRPTNNIPCYLYELPQGVFYGFPEIGGRMKIAEHSGGEPIADPLRYDRQLHPVDAERVQAFIGECLPNATNGLAEHQTCLYTMSPDEHFIIDRHPQEPNVVFAAGLSGHGFKFTPVLGKALAEMALDGGTGLPVEFLRRGRLG